MALCQYIVSGSADAAMAINVFIVSISDSLFGTARTSNETSYGPFSWVDSWLCANTLCLGLLMLPWQSMYSLFQFLIHCLVLLELQMRHHMALV